MKRLSACAAGAVVVLLGLFLATAPAWAQLTYGPFTISGQYSYIINSNDGHQNPNNAGFAPGLPGLTENTQNPMFDYMGQSLQLRITGRFGEHWSIFLEPQVWDDLTKSVDGHYVQYESHPWRYRGSGFFLGGGGNDLKATLWQGFTDYRNGPLWIRVGRQSVAWGEEIALLVLDQVDSLDISDYFFYGRAFDEFDPYRIPELGVRADYEFETALIPNLAIDTFLSPGTWTPDIIPSQGSPYNSIPAYLLYREDVHQGRMIAAVRLSGSISGADLTLNVLTRPQSFPVPIAGNFVPSKETGLPLSFLCPPGPLCRVYTRGEHPRFWLFGGSANYYFPSVGAMARIETAFIPDSPGALTTAEDVPVKVIKRPVLNSMIDIDRPTYVLPGQSALAISYEMEVIYNMGGTHHVMSIAPNPGVNVTSYEVLPAFFLQQPLFHDTVDVDFLGVFDTAGGHWLQPGVHYQMGNHYAFDIYYNSFGGAKSSRFPAANWYSDGAWARFTYEF